LEGRTNLGNKSIHPRFITKKTPKLCQGKGDLRREFHCGRAACLGRGCRTGAALGSLLEPFLAILQSTAWP
jgi:hypothetical protein